MEYLGSGGATQSAVWCQIKADVYNKPFVVARREDGGEGGHSLGLYTLTAYAAGMCEDVGAYVEHLLPNRQVFEPSAERHALYEDLFGIYRRVSRQLLDDFDRLAAVSQKHGLTAST
jgi:sugar (pentulose or hexulose) kinase